MSKRWSLALAMAWAVNGCAVEADANEVCVRAQRHVEGCMGATLAPAAACDPQVAHDVLATSCEDLRVEITGANDGKSDWGCWLFWCSESEPPSRGETPGGIACEPPWHDPELQPYAFGTLVVKQGSVQVKRSDSQHWEDVVEGATVYFGDLLFVADDGASKAEVACIGGWPADVPVGQPFGVANSCTPSDPCLYQD